MDIEVVLNAGAIIGESPTWVAAEKALYWIDIKRPALFRLELETGAQRSWPMPSDIGAFALTQDGAGAVVALRTGLFRLLFADGGLSLLAEPPFDPSLFRFNEGACDSAGRFWIGVMFDPLVPGDPPPRASSLHSFSAGQGLRLEPDAAELHNGMAWSPDGGTFYISHSQRRAIYAFPFEAETGRLGPRSLFVQVADDDGIPDGAVVDTGGGYWCALHGAGRLRRYTEGGQIDRDIVLPVSQPTMGVFAGAAMNTLYVTSASEKLNAQQLSREPLAGAIFRLKPAETGIPRHPYVKL